LSAEEKADVLLRFDMLKLRAEGATPEVGALGGPEPVMFPYIDTINGIDGVCVIQSCAGHPSVEESDQPPLAGQLWLRMDEFTSRVFDHRAFALANDGRFYKVARLYRATGMEVVWVVFQARDEDERALALSILLAFLRSLV
jgi:hypothetical protein